MLACFDLHYLTSFKRQNVRANVLEVEAFNHVLMRTPVFSHVLPYLFLVYSVPYKQNQITLATCI